MEQRQRHDGSPSRNSLSPDLLRDLYAVRVFFAEKIRSSASALCTRLAALADVDPDPRQIAKEMAEALKPDLQGTLRVDHERVGSMMHVFEILDSIVRNHEIATPGSPIPYLRYYLSELRNLSTDRDISTIGAAREVNRFEAVNLSLSDLYARHRNEFDSWLGPRHR